MTCVSGLSCTNGKWNVCRASDAIRSGTRYAKWAGGSRSQTHSRAAMGDFTQDDGYVRGVAPTHDCSSGSLLRTSPTADRPNPILLYNWVLDTVTGTGPIPPITVKILVMVGRLVETLRVKFLNFQKTLRE